MSALEIRKCNVTTRTRRRWCETGRFEGAYKENGLWRFPPLTPEQIDELGKLCMTERLNEFKRHCCPDFDFLNEAILAAAGFPDVHFAEVVNDSEICPGEPAYRWRYEISPEDLRKIFERDLLTMLKIKVQTLRLHGIDPVTTRDLASILGFKSVKTLYNRYGQEMVHEALRRQPILPEIPTDSGPHRKGRKGGRSRMNFVGIDNSDKSDDSGD
jgi:hypothetical protein